MIHKMSHHITQNLEEAYAKFEVECANKNKTTCNTIIIISEKNIKLLDDEWNYMFQSFAGSSNGQLRFKSTLIYSSKEANDNEIIIR